MNPQPTDLESVALPIELLTSVAESDRNRHEAPAVEAAAEKFSGTLGQETAADRPDIFA